MNLHELRGIQLDLRKKLSVFLIKYHIVKILHIKTVKYSSEDKSKRFHHSHHIQGHALRALTY